MGRDRGTPHTAQQLEETELWVCEPALPGVFAYLLHHAEDVSVILLEAPDSG